MYRHCISHALLLLFMSHCATNLDGVGADSSASAEGVPEGFSCTEKVSITYDKRPREPDVFLAIDRSESMINSENDLSGGGSRWQAMDEAVTGLVDSYPKVKFGLSLFPKVNEGCAAGEINVNLAANNAALVKQTIKLKIPDSRGFTPTTKTLKNILAYYKSQNELSPDGSFVLLATDGSDSCGGSERPDEIAGQLLELGVKTFAVGFGDRAIGFEELKKIAVSGGTDDFHSIDSGAALNEIFDKILGDIAVASCTLELKESPVYEAGIAVEIDGESIAKGADGWLYHPSENTIKLGGNACSLLRKSTNPHLTVDLGCGAVPVE